MRLKNSFCLSATTLDALRLIAFVGVTPASRTPPSQHDPPQEENYARPPNSKRPSAIGSYVAV